jgi:hypothetical protein
MLISGKVGDKYPRASILGIDLRWAYVQHMKFAFLTWRSPIQPAGVPPNVKVTVDECESNWLYDDNHFDYVHSRPMAKTKPKSFRKPIRTSLTTYLTSFLKPFLDL